MDSRDHETSGIDLDLTDILSEVGKSLESCLKTLKSLGPRLEEAIHHDERLPDAQVLEKAAQAVDLANQVQQLLDPSELILADHFLGNHFIPPA
ncbi:uncharacterized protein PG998_004569 [Apiospora kogelbergensis]|uniref:uncharacterized protein n=1 Tax=Apiospora kogelbergensis TaxID=1337665 RepID=UPI00312CE168